MALTQEDKEYIATDIATAITTALEPIRQEMQQQNNNTIQQINGLRQEMQQQISGIENKLNDLKNETSGMRAGFAASSANNIQNIDADIFELSTYKKY